VDARSQARFPDVPLEAPHYESFYLKASHPSEPLAVWIRYTVHKRPGERAKGSLWFTFFDAAADGPRAAKVTLAPGELGVAPGEYMHVGDSRFSPGRVSGSALDASWELELDSDEPAFRHLARDWMYRAKLPRTKLLSPHPSALFRGRVRVGDRTVELDGWLGMVGHNWGSEHAERWIWMQGAGFRGNPGAWLDAALGRIKLGPLTTPWIGNGVLSLGGVRHRLGGPERLRSTEVRETPERCDFVLPGKGVTVRGSVGSERRNFVGWVYADPDGSEHNTVNCSISTMRLTVSRPGLEDLELEAPAGAAYELGMREHDHGVPLQPFPDGA